MGLFQQRPEEQENQWKLPSEPFERAEAEVLGTAPAVDPLRVGFADTASVTSISLPLDISAPDADE